MCFIYIYIYLIHTHRDNITVLYITTEGDNKNALPGKSHRLSNKKLSSRYGKTPLMLLISVRGC